MKTFFVWDFFIIFKIGGAVVGGPTYQIPATLTTNNEILWIENKNDNGILDMDLRNKILFGEFSILNLNVESDTLGDSNDYYRILWIIY